MNAHLRGSTARIRSGLLPVVAVVSVSAALVAGCSSGNGGGVATNAPTAGSAASSETIPPAQDSATGSVPPTVAATDAAAVLTEAAKVTQMMHSVHIVMKVDKNVQGVPLQSLTGDVTNQPSVAAQGEGSFRIDEKYVSAKFVVIDGNLYAQLAGAAYKNFGPAKSVYDPAVILNKDLGLGHLLGAVKSPKSAGSESLAGTQTIKITGTVDSAVVDKIIPSKSPTGAQNTSGDLPITVWLSEKAPHNLVQAEITMGSGKVTIQSSDWEKKVSISKPATS
ncbi:LppX_LprAFG lipoprotein [Tsukamurella sp. 8F]|uniref:LppX_LprAFG lipoprotein n=1 Tax=unclassified Tsukamurella TaxID=2633480 RepID=UPI0023B8E53F|nr:MULTISPECIES: LppX_LprAFG lipoprotein [unclassified Tsukamurella]MDF0529087.1 LppX_LprAFG lipoprotein [Tsukamurella sp. 8J]MDF0589010.1 LppX_LprAFG lipoprotein [Tsukamurella sp. 8F]